jgi:carboxylesterase
VLHGLTGTPKSVEGLAGALASAGFAVEVPLLPGHGTSVEDMEPTRWADWVEATEAAFRDLAGAHRPLVVAGLSMGGSLACHLAAEHPDDVSGLIAINPFVDPPAASFRDALRGILDAGFTRAPGIGGDTADPSAAASAAAASSSEMGYDELPIVPLLSLCEGLDDLLPRLGRIRCPVLLLTSTVDHVVPTVSSDMLAERVAGPVERVWLERSYHLATLDHDRHEVEARAVQFATKAVAGADAYHRSNGPPPHP